MPRGIRTGRADAKSVTTIQNAIPSAISGWVTADVTVTLMAIAGSARNEELVAISRTVLMTTSPAI